MFGKYSMKMNLMRICLIIAVVSRDYSSAFTLSKPKALSVDCSSQGNSDEFKHRLKLRKNAEDQATIWLFKNEELNIHFQLPNAAIVDILDVRYSNDGGVDTVALSLDNQELGRFKTADHFGWGDFWNMFESSGPIGGHQHLDAGEHKLTISVVEADLYGVEIDYIRFNVHGSKVDHLHKDQFSCVHNPANLNKPSLRQRLRRKII